MVDLVEMAKGATCETLVEEEEEGGLQAQEYPSCSLPSLSRGIKVNGPPWPSTPCALIAA